jgi:hypothetical protein
MIEPDTLDRRAQAQAIESVGTFQGLEFNAVEGRRSPVSWIRATVVFDCITRRFLQ